MVILLRHLVRFRVEGIYSPAVMRELARPWDGERGGPRQWSGPDGARNMMATHPVTAGRRDEPPT